MFEKVEKINDVLKPKRTYITIRSYFTEKNIVCCDEEHYSASAILVNACTLHFEKRTGHYLSVFRSS